MTACARSEIKSWDSNHWHQRLWRKHNIRSETCTENLGELCCRAV